MRSRRALFICACLGMLTFGIVLTVLGAVLPSVIERFGIDKAQAGSLFLLMTLAILAASLVFGPMVDRYGYKGMLLLATALIAVGLEGIAFAGSLGILRVAIVLIGFGGGIINGGTNALVADISSEEKNANLNLLGVFFGIGAVGVPFVLATLGESFAHSTLIAAVGALVLIPLLVIAVTEFPAPKQAQGFPIAAAGRLVRDPLLLMMGFMLFLESGMEITVGGWTSTFVNEELAVPARRALVILSLYWLGMMLARLALGTFLKTVPPARAMFVCIVVGLAGALVLLFTREPQIAAISVFMLGVGFAATFPTVLGFVGERYANLSGTAFSLVIAMALCGGMLMPWLAGVIGASKGMRESFVIVPVALVLLALLLGILSRALRTNTANR
ncbi:MAG TPA: MFS transporter [Gemmatimonadaceae bacterium]|nr:MFS transporter [Gemmatimonadaceae bacterium]